MTTPSWRGETETPPEPPNKLIYTLFQPVVVTTLVGCVTWSVAQAIASLIPMGTSEPLDRALFLWAISVLMTFLGFRTQRVVGKRFLSGNDANRAKLIELAVAFLGVKFLHHLGDTVPELVNTARSWTQSPLTFFDTESVVAYAIGVGGWLAAGLTARDMDEIIDPVPMGTRAGDGATDPRRRIVNRYFIGGAILLFFTALNRVNFRSILQATNSRIQAPIGNVLLYFFLGILMLGQLQWLRLSSIWQRQKVDVSPDLAPTWPRYTLLFVGLAALLAFLMPTGYTVGILDLVSMGILLLSYLATLLYLLLLWPFALLLSLLTGKSESIEPPRMDRLPFTPPPVPTGADGNPWWAVARSVLFWIALVAVVIYLIRSYIRDRPGFMEILRRFTPGQWLGQLWRGLRRWLRGVAHKLPSAIPTLIRRLRNAAARRRATSKRVRGLSAREQVIYHYMMTLDQAQEEGLGRRQIETPYEYHKTLSPHLGEGQEALTGLTEAFVAARYSTRPFTAEEVQAQATNAAQVRQSLIDAKRDQQDAETGRNTAPR